MRTLQPGTTFTLSGHPEHEAGLAQGDTGEAQFVVLGVVVHRARNNLSADAHAGLQYVLGHVPEFGQLQAVANDSDEPLYEARFCARRTSVPLRASARNDQGRLVLSRPYRVGHANRSGGKLLSATRQSSGHGGGLT